MLEMCKLIPELVKRFDFEIDMPPTRWETKNYWFVKPENFRLRIVPRS
jgi:hypothetical protein